MRWSQRPALLPILFVGEFFNRARGDGGSNPPAGAKIQVEAESHHPVLKKKLHFWDGYNSKSKDTKKI